MITESRLRQALARAGDGATPDVLAAEEQVLRRLHEPAPPSSRPSTLRRRVVVAAVAAAVAAVILVPGLVRDEDDNATASDQLPANGPVTPGQYRLVDGYPRPIVLDLDEGWSVDAREAGDLRLQVPGTRDAVVGLVRARRVIDASDRSVRAPVDMTTWLKTRQDLVVRHIEAVAVGDLFGTRLELRASRRPAATSLCGTPCVPLLDAPAGPVVVPAGTELTIVAINDAGRFVLGYAIAPPAESGAASEALDELLSSAGISADRP